LRAEGIAIYDESEVVTAYMDSLATISSRVSTSLSKSYAILTVEGRQRISEIELKIVIVIARHRQLSLPSMRGVVI